MSTSQLKKERMLNINTTLICTSTKALLLGILVMLGCKSADQNKVQQKLLVGKWSGVLSNEWSDYVHHIHHVQHDTINLTFSSQDVLIDNNNSDTPEHHKYTLKGDTLAIEKYSENIKIYELTKNDLKLGSFDTAMKESTLVLCLIKFHRDPM